MCLDISIVLWFLFWLLVIFAIFAGFFALVCRALYHLLNREKSID
jgi:hypothetical protein